MEKFEPIGLRSNQFGLVAAIAILAAWIPNLVSIPPITHIVKMDIGERTSRLGNDGLMVEVLETSEVRANGLPITLYELSMLAHKLKPQTGRVVLKPDPCAPYDMVIKTIATLKREAPNSFSFADPDYSTSFGKASRTPDKRAFEGVLWPNADMSNSPLNFRRRLATTMRFSDECRQKAFPDRQPDIVG